VAPLQTLCFSLNIIRETCTTHLIFHGFTNPIMVADE